MRCLFKSCTRFLIFEFSEFFIYSRHESCHICDLQIFLPAWDLSCSLLVSFTGQKCLALMKSNLASFSFMDCACSVVSKDPLPNPRSQRCSPVSFQTFYALMFKSIIYSGLIFAYDGKFIPRSIYLFGLRMCSYPSSSAERTILSPLAAFASPEVN